MWGGITTLELGQLLDHRLLLRSWNLQWLPLNEIIPNVFTLIKSLRLYFLFCLGIDCYYLDNVIVFVSAQSGYLQYHCNTYFGPLIFSLHIQCCYSQFFHLFIFDVITRSQIIWKTFWLELFFFRWLPRANHGRKTLRTRTSTTCSSCSSSETAQWEKQASYSGTI